MNVTCHLPVTHFKPLKTVLFASAVEVTKNVIEHVLYQRARFCVVALKLF